MDLLNSETKIFDDIFPSLVWVLRDFTLQLQDDDGSNFSATSYLEKVLNYRRKSSINTNDKSEANNSTNNNDNNNSQELINSNKESVRQIIKYYFKNRECLTMVRPTHAESDLQNLDNLSNDKLRPDFLEQVIYLRKKIFSNCRPKTFNGVKLNSISYLNIIKDYIEVMNSGKLPSIDSTWNNLCKYENQKALGEAEKIYEEFLKENSKKLFDEKELNELHIKAKELSLDLFKRKSLGDISNEMKKALKKNLTEKLQIFSNSNQEETKGELFNFMKNGFIKIEQKLKKNEINSMDDLENEILMVENSCKEIFPNSKIREEMTNDFKYKTIFSNSKFIIDKLINEKNFLFENFQSEANKFLDEKENIYRELAGKNEEIKRKENDYIRLKEDLNLMKEKNLIYENHKKDIVDSCEDKIKKILEENNSVIQKLNEKYVIKDKELKESDKKFNEIKEKYERENAEMIVKMNYLNSYIEDMEKKNKEKSNVDNDDIIKFKEEINYNKNKINNLEDRLKEAIILNNNNNDKIHDLENRIFQKDNIFDIEKTRYEDNLDKNILEKNENNEKFRKQKITYEENINKLTNEIETKNKEIKRFEDLLRKNNDEKENKINELIENSKNFTKKSEKDLAVEKQENQFLQIKCNELIKQNEDNKSNYETTLANLQKKMQEEIILLKEKFNEIKNSEIETEKKIIEQNFLKEKILIEKEIDLLKEKYNNKEIENKKIIEEFEERIKKDNLLIEKLKADIKNLNENKKNSDNEIVQQNEENNLKFKKFMSEFEKKMEEKEIFYKNDIDSVNKNCEETIKNYKVMFEEEKNRLEESRKEERNKYEKKLKIIQEENASKLLELEKEYKNELDNLREENEDIEENSKNFMMEAENQMIILNQKLLTTEANLRENKEILATFQSQFNNSLEKKNESFNLERNDLLKKIDNIQNELNIKDQEFTSLKFKLETYEKNCVILSNQISKEKKDNDENKNELLNKNDILKNK